MSDEQRAGVAMVLMLAILLIYAKFFRTSGKPAPPSKPVATSVQKAPTRAAAPPAAKSEAAPRPAPRAKPSAPTAMPVSEASAEETVTVESDLYRVQLSNRGAVAHSWELKKYRNNDKPPKPLELVHADAAQQLKAWPLSVKLDDPKLEAEANAALYTVTTKPEGKPPAAGGITLQAPAEIDFEWSDGHLHVSKILKFSTGYQTELDVSATWNGSPLPVGVAWRGGFGDQSAYKEAEQVEVFYSENGKFETLEYKKLGVKDHQNQPAQVTAFMDAAGIEDRYFTAAFLPNTPGLSLWDWLEHHRVTAGGKTTEEPVAEMAVGPQSAGPLIARVYVGPKELSLLGKLNPSLTGLVQFGYMSLIAKGLLWILKWMHKYIPNYGWAIVLLTIAINMALYPLKAKSWSSMKKMQKVAPKMKAIQEKYKKYSIKDPRRREMNEEMSKLYKEHGVNPLGGCLPQVVQIPIWWALFRMLEYSIELRHAPWVWWIHDLSVKDPYYILPIIMTISYYFMGKMTPMTVTDPTQQKMMTYMPVFMGLLFFNLQSGLVLYICASSLVGVAQQWYLNRTDPLPSRSPFKNKPAKA